MKRLFFSLQIRFHLNRLPPRVLDSHISSYLTHLPCKPPDGGCQVLTLPWVPPKRRNGVSTFSGAGKLLTSGAGDAPTFRLTGSRRPVPPTRSAARAHTWFPAQRVGGRDVPVCLAGARVCALRSLPGPPPRQLHANRLTSPK